MTKLYFIVLKQDLTQNMIDYSIQGNPFYSRESLDGSKLILKFNLDNVPIDLYNLGYIPITHSDILSIINDGLEW